MPASLEKYYQSLLDLLAASAIVQGLDISFDKRSSVLAFIRGDLHLADGSLLHFRELVDMRDPAVRTMYVYHYQDIDSSLIFRYDSTPHYPDLAHFPHHKHTGKESKATPAEPQDLFLVMREIEECVDQGRTRR